MFEVGVARTFHALHQLEAEDPAAGHEHSHDYRAEVVARGEQLDQNAMLVDIDALGAALAGCLAELDTADLGTLAAFEGQATTVEAVAEHVWTHVRELLVPPPGVVGLRVTVYESADAWASVDRPVEESR
jgi:6-pyruvoyltetrahydropterin/6-carboxytetrahydropterin synthase